MLKETSSTATVAPNALRSPRTAIADAPGRSAMQPSERLWIGIRSRAGERPALLEGSESELRLADQRGVEADLRRLVRKDRGEPAGVGDDRRAESVAPGLHLFPGAFF